MTDTRRFIPIALAVLFTIPGFLPRLFHTAAQSLMAVALLVGLRLGPRGAILLFGFFIRQSFAPGVLATVSGFLPFMVGTERIHLSISVLHAMGLDLLAGEEQGGRRQVAPGLADRGCGRKTSAGARARGIICVSSALIRRPHSRVSLPGLHIGDRIHIQSMKTKEVNRMLCPVCNVELSIADRQGIEIDYCPKCRGVWLDRGELDKLIERSAMPPAHRGDYREAPVHQRQPVYHEGEHHKPDGQHHKHKRKSLLGEIFDFD